MKNIIEIIRERKFKYISFFWIIISIQFVIGSNLQTKGYSINGISEFLISLLKIILFSIIFITLHYCVLDLYKKCKKDRKKEHTYIIKKYNWIIYFFIIILGWIPALLAFFPVVPNYDGGYQIRDCLTNAITTRHPIIHTLMISGFYKLGELCFESTTIGMFLYSVAQMTIMASIFAYAVKFIEEKTNKRWLRNISLIFFAIFPVNQLFPIMTTKDVIFAGLTLLFIINLYEIYEGKNKLPNYIFVILIATLMVLFRNNAIYAILVLIPFIILVLRKDKKIMKIMISILLLTILSYQLVYNFIINITNAEMDSNQEKMSIFSQSVAKVCNEKGQELSREEKAKISYFFTDYKKLGEVYQSNISDNTKNLIKTSNVDENKTEFYKLIISLVKKYPMTCIDSFLNTIRGYWYICDNSFNQIWHKEWPDTMGYFELPFNEEANPKEYKAKGYSIIPELKEFYRDMFCRNHYREIPVLFIIFQPATYFYIIVAYLLYAIYKREKRNLILGTYLFLYFGTCFLGPVAIVRYIYAVIVSTPILLTSIIKSKEEVKDEK